MQKEAQGATESYSGELLAVKDILRRHGPRGLYLGFSLTIIR
jgi:hypothetical protein